MLDLAQLRNCVSTQYAYDLVSDLEVKVYWRPGCGDCIRVRRGLAKSGIETVEHNIWEDQVARSYVKSVAHGNETVPTVVIGDVSLVNPSVDQVVAEITKLDPTFTVKSVTPERGGDSSKAIFQWLVVGLLIVLSLYVERLGHVGLSWAVDVVNVVFWFSLRTYRRRRI